MKHFLQKPGYLYVPFMRTHVSIHALDVVFIFPQVDAEERPPSHWILHTGVMRW